MARIAEPRHEVLDRDGAFEVRRYPGRVIAETRVLGPWSAAGNEGFRRLAGYIFGKNRGRAKVAMTAPVGQRPATIAMTAPVGQRRDADAWLVTFTMPAGETLATLPVPGRPPRDAAPLPPGGPRLFLPPPFCALLARPATSAPSPLFPPRSSPSGIATA